MDKIFTYFKRTATREHWIPDLHPNAFNLDLMNDQQVEVHRWCAEAFGPQGDRWFADGDNVFVAAPEDAKVFKKRWS